jgi:hypothetical protein
VILATRRITIQVFLRQKKKVSTYLKNKAKKGWVTQVVEHLPSKCEALSSNPSATKKKKKKEYLTQAEVEEERRLKQENQEFLAT